MTQKISALILISTLFAAPGDIFPRADETRVAAGPDVELVQVIAASVEQQIRTIAREHRNG